MYRCVRFAGVLLSSLHLSSSRMLCCNFPFFGVLICLLWRVSISKRWYRVLGCRVVQVILFFFNLYTLQIQNCFIKLLPRFCTQPSTCRLSDEPGLPGHASWKYPWLPQGRLLCSAPYLGDCIIMGLSFAFSCHVTVKVLHMQPSFIWEDRLLSIAGSICLGALHSCKLGPNLGWHRTFSVSTANISELHILSSVFRDSFPFGYTMAEHRITGWMQVLLGLTGGLPEKGRVSVDV